MFKRKEIAMQSEGDENESQFEDEYGDEDEYPVYCDQMNVNPADAPSVDSVTYPSEFNYSSSSEESPASLSPVESVQGQEDVARYASILGVPAETFVTPTDGKPKEWYGLCVLIINNLAW